MKFNKKQAKQTLKHAALTGLRLSGIAATYYMLSSKGNVASSLAVAAQAPGAYNQARHFAQHATATIFPESSVSRGLSRGIKSLPKAPGPVTIIRNTLNTFFSVFSMLKNLVPNSLTKNDRKERQKEEDVDRNRDRDTYTDTDADADAKRSLAENSGQYDADEGDSLTESQTSRHAPAPPVTFSPGLSFSSPLQPENTTSATLGEPARRRRRSHRIS